MVPARRIGITVLFILYNAESAERGNGKHCLNDLIKIAKSILKVQPYLLYFLTCVAFTVSVENCFWLVSGICLILQ
jgi:hypothetical protein